MIDLTAERERALGGIRRELAVEIAAAGDLPADRAQAVADGVAHFCLEHAARLEPGRPLLNVLAARALASVGARETAGVFAARVTRRDAEADALVEALARADLSPEALVWIACGLVRPFEPGPGDAAPAWRADFRRLRGEGEALELTGRRVLRQTIEAMAPLWASGCGTLGLRHLAALVRPVRGARAFRRRVEDGRRLTEYADEVLAACAAERGWTSRPRTVVLDALC